MGPIGLGEFGRLWDRDWRPATTIRFRLIVGQGLGVCDGATKEIAFARGKLFAHGGPAAPG